MNNIELLQNQSNDIHQFIRGYFSYLSDLLKKLDTEEISVVAKELELARERDNTIFLAGNGGSAATASHMANDIGLAAIKKGVEKPFRTLSLTDNVSVITAISNDAGFENLFIQQLQNHHRPGDLLIVISASGNSQNLLSAAEWIKEKGGKVIGLLGFDGGKLLDICDHVILAKTPKGEYGPVEDIHMILDHAITAWLYATILI